jgi:hypothetical protein
VVADFNIGASRSDAMNTVELPRKFIASLTRRGKRNPFLIPALKGRAKITRDATRRMRARFLHLGQSHVFQVVPLGPLATSHQ